MAPKSPIAKASPKKPPAPEEPPPPPPGWPTEKGKFFKVERRMLPHEKEKIFGMGCVAKCGKNLEYMILMQEVWRDEPNEPWRVTRKRGEAEKASFPQRHGPVAANKWYKVINAFPTYVSESQFPKPVGL